MHEERKQAGFRVDSNFSTGAKARFHEPVHKARNIVDAIQRMTNPPNSEDCGKNISDVEINILVHKDQNNVGRKNLTRVHISFS